MRSLYFLISAIGLVLIVSCKKGDQGEPGKDGNANVVQYNFGEVDMAASGFKILNVPTTQDTMNNSAWYVYLHYAPIDRWYAVPGYGFGASSNYRISLNYANPNVVIYIDKTGPGEKYDKARVVRVYSNKQMNLNLNPSKKNIAVNMADYEAMRTYFNLPR